MQEIKYWNAGELYKQFESREDISTHLLEIGYTRWDIINCNFGFLLEFSNDNDEHVYIIKIEEFDIKFFCSNNKERFECLSALTKQFHELLNIKLTLNRLKRYCYFNC